jgi:hypothetical protein
LMRPADGSVPVLSSRRRAASWVSSARSEGYC